MGKDHRVTMEGRRHAYRTNSNRVATIKTPGGKYAAQYISKRNKGVRCGQAGCPVVLPGIKHMSAAGFRSAKSKDKKVSRCFGGNICAGCVKQRIVRAFLIEEQKIVKKVLVEKSKKVKA
jgi:large subunit ribosomal protein L34e